MEFLNDATAEGRKLLFEVDSKTKANDKKVDDFLKMRGNEVYKAYFTNVSKLDNDFDIDREIAFLEFALNIMKDKKQTNNDDVKDYLKKVRVCVTMMSTILSA